MKKFIFLIIICLCFLGCGFLSEHQLSEGSFLLPENAIELENLGNGWIIFKSEILHKERIFLYHKSVHINEGYESITELSNYNPTESIIKIEESIEGLLKEIDKKDNTINLWQSIAKDLKAELKLYKNIKELLRKGNNDKH